MDSEKLKKPKKVENNNEQIQIQENSEQIETQDKLKNEEKSKIKDSTDDWKSIYGSKYEIQNEILSQVSKIENKSHKTKNEDETQEKEAIYRKIIQKSSKK